MHLLDNVASSYEVSFDVELRKSGPVRESLDTLTQGIILQNIYIFEVLDVIELQNLKHVV